jgi:hypothetical protein
MTPTLLYSVGMDIPSDSDGKVMEAAFDLSHLSAYPIVVGEPSISPHSYALQDKKIELNANEEQAVMDQLRALGYVE